MSINQSLAPIQQAAGYYNNTVDRRGKQQTDSSVRAEEATEEKRAEKEAAHKKAEKARKSATFGIT